MEAHTEKVRMPAQQNSLSFNPRPGLLTLAPDSIHPLDGENVLFFSRPPRSLTALRQIGKEQVAEQSNWDCDNAIYNKQPSPARTAVHATQVGVSSCLQKPTE